MKSVVYHSYGPATNFSIEEIGKPSPADDEALVRVHAASINPVDWKVRQGDLKIISGRSFPKQSGSDFAGTIVKAGKKISGFAPGDHVYGTLHSTKGGAYAEYLSAPSHRFAKMPENLSFEEAAGIPMAAMTALQSLRDKGEIAAGQNVLINGASGGVGSFAVQIAKIFGAVVTGVCSSNHIALVKSLRADQVIDYTNESFTKDRGAYDIIVDAVGKSSFKKSKRSLKAAGIYITTLPGLKISIQRLFTGLWPGKKAKWMLMSSKQQDMDQITAWIQEGKIKVPIAETFPLEQISEAHQLSEKGHAGGKIILKVR